MFILDSEFSDNDELFEELSEPEIILLYTEQAQYSDGDTIIVTGLVSSVESPTLLIGIYDPFGLPAGFYFGTINSDLEFSTSFLVKSGVNFRTEGTYSVKAHYGESEATSFFDYYESIPDTTTESIPDTTTESIPDTTTESIPDTTTESIPDTTTESIPDTTTESIPDTTTETVPDTTTETVPDTTTETVPDTTTETIPDTTTETVPDTTTETVPDTTTETVPDTTTETVPDTTSETVPDTTIIEQPTVNNTPLTSSFRKIRNYRNFLKIMQILN